MKRQLLLALLAAGLAAAPGCADKRDAVPGIRITPSIKTRVTGLHFDTGDCIGLTVTKNGSDYVRNHQMTYDGSAFTASGLLWYNDLNETSTLTAYFPYSASGVPDEFSVARDQSAGCASSDLLGAVAKNVTPTGTPVGMLFYHLMSQLTIVITNNSDAAVSGVAVGGFVQTAVRLTRATAGRLPNWNTAAIPTARRRSADRYGWPRTCATSLRVRRSAMAYGIPRRGFPRWRKKGCCTIIRR